MRISYACGCCAGGMIESLGSSGANATEAMKEFCKLELGGGSGLGGGQQTLSTFYVFIAGPEQPGYGHSKYWSAYGTEFAQFIRDEKLGSVETLGPKLNAKFHPSTTCQIWIWSPDQKAMVEWWKNERKKTPEKKPEPVVGTVKAKYSAQGYWDVAHGVAGGHYRCGHCQKTYTTGERIWYGKDGQYYCEVYGKKAEKGEV